MTKEQFAAAKDNLLMGIENGSIKTITFSNHQELLKQMYGWFE